MVSTNCAIYKTVFDCGALVLLSAIFNHLKLSMCEIRSFENMLINPFPNDIKNNQIVYTFNKFNKKHML